MADERRRQKRIAKKRARRREKRIAKPVAYLRRSTPRLPAALLGMPKISDAIVEFAEPLVDEFLEDGADAAEVRTVLLLAATLWNAVITADELRSESDEAAAVQLRNDLIDRLEYALERPRGACEVIVDEMARRKRELFDEDPRFIVDIDTYDTADGVRVIAAARL